MKQAVAAAALVALISCTGDETVTGYGGAGQWTLSDMNGAQTSGMSMTLTADGTIRAAGPCAILRARQTAPYPWFRLQDKEQAERACAGRAGDQAFFAELGQATLVEVTGDVLILSDPDGLELVFSRKSPYG